MILVPTITSIFPIGCEANSTSFTLTITGTNFDPSSIVYWDGSPLASVVEGPTQITATVAPTNVPTAGVYSVQVSTPESAPEMYDGGNSNIVEFQAIVSVSDAQEHMCDLVDAYRKSLMLNGFTYGGTQWDSDDEDIRNLMGINILSILNGGNIPAGTQWRDSYNTNHAATAGFMGGMAAAFLTYGVNAYNAAWQHKANIRALTDTVSVWAYDYQSTLWPNPLTQY